MTLRLDQLKKLKIPLSGQSSCNCGSNCGITVSLYDVLTSFAALGTTIYTDDSIDGNGSLATPLKIAQQGAEAGQSLTWNGTGWVPANSGTLPVGGLYDQLVHDGDGFVKVSPHWNVQLMGSGSAATLPTEPSNLIKPMVFLNGVLKEEEGDYTLASNVLTFLYNFQNNDKLTTLYYTT